MTRTQTHPDTTTGWVTDCEIMDEDAARLTTLILIHRCRMYPLESMGPTLHLDLFQQPCYIGPAAAALLTIFHSHSQQPQITQRHSAVPVWWKTIQRIYARHSVSPTRHGYLQTRSKYSLSARHQEWYPSDSVPSLINQMRFNANVAAFDKRFKHAPT